MPPLSPQLLKTIERRTLAEVLRSADGRGAANYRTITETLAKQAVKLSGWRRQPLGHLCQFLI